MEPPGSLVDHIRHVRFGCNGPAVPGKRAAPIRVVDLDARLHVGAPHREGELAAVIKGKRLHDHAAAHQLVALEKRLDAVQDAPARALHVVGDHVLVWQHALDVEVARAGDQIPLVGVLAGELVADQVTAVVQVVPVNPPVVAGRLPTGGLHHADTLALLRRHRAGRYDRRACAASAQAVELGVHLGQGRRLGRVEDADKAGDIRSRVFAVPCGHGGRRRCRRLRRPCDRGRCPGRPHRVGRAHGRAAGRGDQGGYQDGKGQEPRRASANRTGNHPCQTAQIESHNRSFPDRSRWSGRTAPPALGSTTRSSSGRARPPRPRRLIGHRGPTARRWSIGG